jgi:hypothetical protein
MKYPTVLSEQQTILTCQAMSCARFGDGELRVAKYGGCVSQTPDARLALELQNMLAEPPPGLLVCIPNVDSDTPRAAWKANWATDKWVSMYAQRATYGSSFITRPDSAPWIDTTVYWDYVRDLWRGKDVVFVTGDERSLRHDQLTEAASIRDVRGPSKHAYAHIDRIEEEIGKHHGPVIMCLGCTATALAARLAKKGVHALDLGHIGMFMRGAGAYRYAPDDLCSPGYRALLQDMHARQPWGGSGATHLSTVLSFMDEIKPATTLDYGCGRKALANAMLPFGIRVQSYDPGIIGNEGIPKLCDLVVCTDVLEHIEPDKLGNVLDHMFRVCLKAAYVVISTRPAKAILPDGRNAHICLHDPPWWRERLLETGWNILREEAPGKAYRVWLTKP